MTPEQIERLLVAVERIADGIDRMAPQAQIRQSTKSPRMMEETRQIVASMVKDELKKQK